MLHILLFTPPPPLGSCLSSHKFESNSNHFEGDLKALRGEFDSSRRYLSLLLVINTSLLGVLAQKMGFLTSLSGIFISLMNDIALLSGIFASLMDGATLLLGIIALLMGIFAPLMGIFAPLLGIFAPLLRISTSLWSTFPSLMGHIASLMVAIAAMLDIFAPLMGIMTLLKGLNALLLRLNKLKYPRNGFKCLRKRARKEPFSNYIVTGGLGIPENRYSPLRNERSWVSVSLEKPLAFTTWYKKRSNSSPQEKLQDPISISRMR